jgi:hypothetical protein
MHFRRQQFLLSGGWLLTPRKVRKKRKKVDAAWLGSWPEFGGLVGYAELSPLFDQDDRHAGVTPADPEAVVEVER